MARVLPFPVRTSVRWLYRFLELPLWRSGYRIFHAVFVAAWLLFLGSISFLAMVVR